MDLTDKFAKILAEEIAEEISAAASQVMVDVYQLDHYAAITLVNVGIYKLEERIEEIQSIKDWLDQLVRWDPTQYCYKISSSSGKIHVWFKDERHATICKLRWK